MTGCCNTSCRTHRRTLPDQGVQDGGDGADLRSRDAAPRVNPNGHGPFGRHTKGAGRPGQMRHVSPVDSLVAAVLKANGDGLVMHVGERPYVLSPSGSTNLSERTLTVDAMKGVLSDLLTPATAKRSTTSAPSSGSHDEGRPGGQVPPGGGARR